MLRRLLLVLVAPAVLAAAQLQPVEIKILSTMLSDHGFGEWGFAAVVEAGGRRILFDTGAHEDTVLRNAREMGVDLSGITDVILSHNHLDHTAGLLTLRREYGKKAAGSLATAHAGKGIFLSRGTGAKETNPMPAIRVEYEKAGGKIVEYDGPVEIFPGAWLTGPVPRKYPERNWSGNGMLRLTGGKTAEDNIPEDMSLVLDTDRGLVIVSGCGHAGIVNTFEYAREKVRKAPVYAAIGGFHLFAASDDSLAWTASKLKEFGVQHFLGAHCTGIEAVYKLRAGMGLTRKTCAVGSVGGGFRLDKGLNPGDISR